MNRPLGEVLVDIIAETKRSPDLRAANMRLAATPRIKTKEDCWVWFCEVCVPRATPNCVTRIIGRGETPDEAATDCYRKILAADRLAWRVE